MRFLFWNTNKNGDINDILCKIVIEQKINIVILAEYADVVEDLILNLDLHGVRMKVYPTVGCDRITMLGTEISIRQSRQDTYYSMQIINEQYLLCGLHLPSSLWADKETQSLVFESIVHDVELAEEENGLGKSIVVGDFNQKLYGWHEPFMEKAIKCFIIPCGICWAILIFPQEHIIIQEVKRQMNFGICSIK